MKDLEEIQFQTAIGTLPTAPSVLAKIVKNTDSPVLLLWACSHKNGKVRAAAVSNPLLPDLTFIAMALFDRGRGVQDVVTNKLDDRRENIAKILLDMEKKPEQLELDLDGNG